MTNNIKVTLTYTAIHFVAISIALQSIFSSYIYLLTDGSNSKVGYITGLNGLASCAVAPLCGYLADKHRRDLLLRCAGVVGILVSIATIAGVLEGHYAFLCVCLTSWGVYGGMQNPPMEALFADSIDPGQRSKIFMWKYGLVQAACAIGPLSSVVMFWVLGNEWQLEACQYVIVAGLVLALLSSVLCFKFDDENTQLTLSPATRAVVRRVAEKRRRKIEEEKRRQGLLGEQRSRSCTVLLEGEEEGEGGEEEGEEEVVEDPTSTIFKNAFGRISGVSPALTIPLLQQNEEADEEEDEEKEGEGQQRQVAAESRKCCLGCTARRGSFCFTNYLPSIIVLTDVCFGLASGMSVRFFPLFFMETYNLSPMAVSGIYVLSPLLTSLASFCAQRTSHHLGRVSTTITCKLLGVSLLFLMCFLDYHHVSAFAVIPVYILRTALMNSSKPLTRSIIMDAVPKEDRGKWNSLESVTMATWSGSAVLGGLLVDKYGFLFNNLITASLQLVSTLPLFLVLGLVPCEKNPWGKGEEEEEGEDEEEEEEEEAGMDTSDGSVLGASFSKFFFGAAPPPPGGAGNLEGGREGGVDEENVNAAWEKQLREQLARFKEGREGGREEEEMELPLEGEEDLARLERILKRGRSRAGTVEDVEL